MGGGRAGKTAEGFGAAFFALARLAGGDDVELITHRDRVVICARSTVTGYRRCGYPRRYYNNIGSRELIVGNATKCCRGTRAPPNTRLLSKLITAAAVVVTRVHV